MDKLVRGICSMLSTPFTSKGEVCYDDMERQLGFLLSSGVQGVGLFGIGSEFYKLTDEEKYRLAEQVTGTVKKSALFSMLSVTDHCTEVAVKRARDYEAMGADCLMLLPPHFLNPPISEVKAHVLSVVSSVSIPVVIQYAPNETRLHISPEEMIDIARDYPNVAFKIECNPPVEYSRELIGMKDDITIMNGYLGLYMMDILRIGGKGVIPGPSYPEIYVEILNLFERREYEKAEQLHARLRKYLQDWMLYEYIECYIQVEREILRRRNIIKNDFARRPTYTLGAGDRKRIDDFFTEFEEYLPVRMD